MSRTQVITFPLQPDAPSVFLYAVDLYTIYSNIQLSSQTQKNTSYLFILFLPKTTSLALILVISLLVYCHYPLRKSFPLHLIIMNLIFFFLRFTEIYRQAIKFSYIKFTIWELWKLSLLENNEHTVIFKTFPMFPCNLPLIPPPTLIYSKSVTDLLSVITDACIS